MLGHQEIKNYEDNKELAKRVSEEPLKLDKHLVVPKSTVRCSIIKECFTSTWVNLYRKTMFERNMITTLYG